MFRAIGTVIMLYAIAQMFSASIIAFESAMVAVFGTVETAAHVSTEQLTELAKRQ